jgi:beta-1,4-mannooligosaccharide phosphorylase
VTPTRCPPYYGDSWLDADGTQEAVGQIASVVGATLVGIDKSNQDGIDYVDMLRTFYWPSLGIARDQPTVQTARVPETPDELVGTVGNVVFPTAIESIEGTHYVFYGMADAKIGVARLERT